MTVLCVDPDPGERRATVASLREAGIDAVGCSSVRAANERLDASTAGLVTESDLEDGTGIELVAQVRAVVPDAPCVLFTEAPFDDLETAALGNVVVEYVDKGASDARAELVDLLEFSIDTRSQTAYPLPDDEDARLAALDDYVEDPARLDESLDRLTTVAAALFDVDAATVGFLEAHRERFVACHGTDVDTLDREDTVCTHAILDEGPTVIPDTRDDPRFADNDELTTRDIRFYAGAPIRTPQGEAIGVFCLFDDEPRSFERTDRRLLSTLADDVVERLELRRRLSEATADE